jgi:hypothetical protein
MAMTEQEWLVANNSSPMLEFLRSQGATRRSGGRRKLRLFACACVRGIWLLLRKPGSRKAVEVAEQFADGLASAEELREAYEASRDALGRESSQIGKSPYWQSAEAAGHVAARAFDGGDHPSVAHASSSASLAWIMDQVGRGQGRDHDAKVRSVGGTRRALHAAWLRDIIGNPFRPVKIKATWKTANVIALATAIYDDRAFDRLPILADALEDAGCDNADMLNHCRQPGEHVRGCWVVDLVLGKS